jgi:hypothetical protein
VATGFSLCLLLASFQPRQEVLDWCGVRQITNANPSVIFIATAYEAGRRPIDKTAEHGQHSEEILLEAGYTWEEIGSLLDSEVI